MYIYIYAVCLQRSSYVQNLPRRFPKLYLQMDFIPRNSFSKDAQIFINTHLGTQLNKFIYIYNESKTSHRKT